MYFQLKSCIKTPQGQIIWDVSLFSLYECTWGSCGIAIITHQHLKTFLVLYKKLKMSTDYFDSWYTGWCRWEVGWEEIWFAIQDGHQSFIFDEKKMIILLVDRHVDWTICHIVFILGENIAKYGDIPNGWNLAETRNPTWLPGGCFTWKWGTLFYEHILLKFGMQFLKR